jgi:hypothetical protein
MLKRLFPLLLLSLFAMTTVFAQDIHELDEGYKIETPSDWVVFLADDGMRYFMNDGDEVIMMSLFTPTQIDAVMNPNRSRKSTRHTPEEVMQEIILEFDSIEVREKDIEDIEYAGYEGSAWFFSYDDLYNGVALVLEIEDNRLLYLDYYVMSGDLDDATEIVEPIVESFGLDNADMVSEEDSEPCFVTADEANTARLRVGPGENRSAVAFLKPDQEFPVLGKFTTDDDAVWYQLDKSEVAPDSSAMELWVAEAEIEEVGACDAVADASAPPVIPSTAGGGSSSGSGESGEGTTTTEVGTLPVSGSWTMTLDATTYASCEGTETVSMKTSDFFDTFSYAILIQTAADGSTINFNDDVLRLNNQPGNYLGSADLGGGMNAQLYLTVNSTTTMSGRVVANMTFESVGCSATVYFGMSR